MKERRDSPIGLEEMSAYVDGELDSGRRAAVERHLSSDRAAAARVAAYRRQDDCLRQGLAPLAEDSSSWRLRATLQSRAGGGSRIHWWMAAVAASILIMVVGGGWWYHADRLPNRLMAALVNSAVTAHIAYVSKEVPPDVLPDRSKLTVAFRGVVGAGANLPNLASLGYDLIGGEGLDTAAGSAVLLAYRNRSGDIVTCYFGGKDRNSETQYSVEQFQGVNVVSRLESGVSYAVIGSVAPDELMKIARMGYRAIGP